MLTYSTTLPHEKERYEMEAAGFEPAIGLYGPPSKGGTLGRTRSRLQ